MSRHTPGPWMAEGRDIYGPADGCDREAFQLAKTLVEDSSQVAFDAAFANARLISAAPDYDALLRRLVDAHYQQNSGETFERIVRQIAIDARAAIAKAEGKS